MQIPPLALSGIASTGDAIRRGNTRLDDKAAQVVTDTTAAYGDAPSDGNLASDLMSMHAESLTNKILFSVFRRQADQQQSAVDLLSPTRSP